MKPSCYTLHTARGAIELSADRIRTNDVRFPWEYSPRRGHLYVIGNEYGALGAVWAECAQDALDELVDCGLGNGLLIDEQNAEENSTRLGNAGEPADLDNVWIVIVWYDKARDFDLILALTEARGQAADTLDNL